MAKNRGTLFEEAIRSSVPVGCDVRKLAATGSPALGQLSSLLDRLARQARENVGWAKQLLQQASHAPQQPYDILIRAPLPVQGGARVGFSGLWLRDALGNPYQLRAEPKLCFALEIKWAGKDAKSLPFDRVRPHQERGLFAAHARGDVAGLVIGFDAGPDADAWFIPIQSWLAYRRDAGRASLPLEMAKRIGSSIEIDYSRGRTRTYYNLLAFLAAFGADREAMAQDPGGLKPEQE